jgi:hypothetical protein
MSYSRRTQPSSVTELAVGRMRFPVEQSTVWSADVASPVLAAAAFADGVRKATMTRNVAIPTCSA